MRRLFICVLMGILVELGALAAASHFGYLNLKAVDWHNSLNLVLFGFGFASACWLVIWSKLWNKIFSHKKKPAASPTPNQTIARPMTHTTQTPPARMAVQNGAVLTVSPAQQPQPASAPAGAPAMGSTNSQPISDNSRSTKEQDITKLALIDPKLDMQAFRRVVLEGKYVDLVYSSDDVAVLCSVLCDQHSWTIDTTKPIEDCVWTDETGATQNPCFQLLTNAAILEKMDTGAEIIPTVIIVRGSITNAQEATAYLAQNQIRLVKYEATAEDNLEDLHKLLVDAFTLIPPNEFENEEDTNEQDNNDESAETSDVTTNQQ